MNKENLITSREFKEKFLSIYLLIEDEFKGALKYVTVDEDNFASFSNIYLKLLLEIGSEILTLLKFIADLYSIKLKKDEGYFSITLELEQLEPDITNLIVKFNGLYSLQPWKHNENEVPFWWTTYNLLKHHRMDKTDNIYNYKQANLKNVLYSLGALHTLEMIAYRKLSLMNHEKVFVPGIKSIFCIDNSYWSDTKTNSPTFVSGENLVFSPDLYY